MEKKTKCTQCGCEDLEEVGFPYKVNLVTVSVGLAGESSSYDLDEELYAKSYICTKCGHFEFFNPELAKIVLEERNEVAKIQAEINKINTQILDKNNEMTIIEQKINAITEQLKSIDITIRQSNEFKNQQQELKKQLKLLKEENQTLIKQQNKLKSKLND